MPVLRWKEMPAGQRIPESYKRTAEEYGLLDRPIRRRTFRDPNYERQFSQARRSLRDQWQIEANALRVKPFKSQAQANAELAKLNSKYQMQELEVRQKLQAQQQEQQQQQQYVMGLRGRKKALTDVELYQAQRRLTGEEERFARLPVEGKPLSPAQLASPSLIETMNTSIESAPTIKKWYVRRKDEPKTGQGLLDAYKKWKDFIQYDEYGFIAQRQLDQVWDLKMLDDDRFKAWQSDKVQTDLKALRSRGRIADIMKKKAVSKSPIGRTLGAVTARQRRAQYFKGVRGAAPEQPQQIPRPTNQAEYNRIPSGSQYIGTDGRIRTKR